MYSTWTCITSSKSHTHNLIAHFRVVVSLSIKVRSGAQPFKWKWVKFEGEWNLIFIWKDGHLIEKSKLVCFKLKHYLFFMVKYVPRTWYMYMTCMCCGWNLILIGILQMTLIQCIYWYVPFILTTNSWVTSIWKLRHLVTTSPTKCFIKI